MTRKLFAALSLSLLAVSCGHIPAAPKAAAPAAPAPQEQVTVLGEGLTSRRIQLPAARPLPLAPQALSPLGLQRAASSPTRWTGPIPAYPSYHVGGRAAVGPQGELTVPDTTTGGYEQSSDFELRKYAATGELLAQQRYTVPRPEASFDPYREVYEGTWIAATEDAPDQDIYALNAYGDSSDMLNPKAPLDTEIRLLDSALQPRTTNVDGPYHPALFLTRKTEMRAGERGVVVSTPHEWNYHGSYDAPVNTRIYELSYHAWDNVEVDHVNTLLPPRQYADHYTGSQMDTAPDGSIYVATFTSYKPACLEACPSVAGITKLRGGQVEWQVFWDSAQPVGLRDVAAHEKGVGLLVAAGPLPEEADAEPQADTSLLLTFSADGTPLQNVELPLGSLSSGDSYLKPFEQLQLKGDGRFVVGSGNVVSAGNMTSGITRTQRLSPSVFELYISELVSRGEYLYVQGGAEPGTLEQVTPPLSLPALGNDRYADIRFVLPYDFDLNPRW